MLQLEIPHINVLSKMDLITQYGELPFNLEYYTEVQDLSYLESSLQTERSGPKFASLNRAICGLIEDYSLVSFETLAVEVRSLSSSGLLSTPLRRHTEPLRSAQDKHSMLHLLRLLDRVIGYAYIPRPTSTSANPTTEESLRAYPLPQLSGVRDVADVQEKWVDNRLDWEEWEGRQRGAQGDGKGQGRSDEKGRTEVAR
jgi:hypothetical protein